MTGEINMHIPLTCRGGLIDSSTQFGSLLLCLALALDLYTTSLHVLLYFRHEAFQVGGVPTAVSKRRL
jgi:hypothetical protein